MLRKKLFSQIFAFLLMIAFSNAPALAQSNQGSDAASALEAREAIGSVLVSGLVGGILGLSTLSFYSEPQDHIRNITLGAGVGMIFAVIYLTSQAAVTPIKVDDKGGRTTFVYPVFDERSVNLAATIKF